MSRTVSLACATRRPRPTHARASAARRRRESSSCPPAPAQRQHLHALFLLFFGLPLVLPPAPAPAASPAASVSIRFSPRARRLRRHSVFSSLLINCWPRKTVRRRHASATAVPPWSRPMESPPRMIIPAAGTHVRQCGMADGSMYPGGRGFAAAAAAAALTVRHGRRGTRRIARKSAPPRSGQRVSGAASGGRRVSTAGCCSWACGRRRLDSGCAPCAGEWCRTLSWEARTTGAPSRATWPACSRRRAGATLPTCCFAACAPPSARGCSTSPPTLSVAARLAPRRSGAGRPTSPLCCAGSRTASSCR
mmetsp:Transcript_26931/g.90740  ORF Transcript_26931/g.90740 Transcript_26931/m.90740 type:complete len:307 (-) Transcript_26931:1018-1938(-)